MLRESIVFPHCGNNSKIASVEVWGRTLFDLREIAILEESRQAFATAEISDESEAIAGGWMAYAGAGSWANQACGLGLQGPVSDADLDRLVQFYVDRSVEPRIEVCPFVDESLITGLVSRGFQLCEFENVLSRELNETDDLRASHPFGWPDDLDILHIDPTDHSKVESFIEVSTRGFRAEGSPVSDVLAATTTRTVKHPRSDSFLARMRNENAGGGGMECSERIACLFGTSVDLKFRRQGIQLALMIRRLERAIECGCELAFIHSQPGIPTERNAMRLGFTLAYTKVVMAMPRSGLVASA